MAKKNPITLRCPTCKRTQENTARKDHDPPRAAIKELECPTCLPDGWRVLEYLDANGKRVS